MAWTIPRTWIPGELVTALMMNTHLRDNLNALYAPVMTYTLADVTTPALDLSQISSGIISVFRLVATGNRTIGIPSGPRAGQRFIIAHFASGGARTLALTAGTGGFRFGSDLTAIAATASGKTDYFGFMYNDVDNKCDLITSVKGF
jgi:hypothetical protein